ncbi:MAG: SAM-dependent methyltransferase, partial [Microcystis sp.]
MNILLVTSSLGLLLAIAIVVYFVSSRKYQSSDSVANSYDQWTEDGILEYYWGEHIHLGHYGSPPEKKDFLAAKADFVAEMVSWGDLDKLPAGATL